MEVVMWFHWVPLFVLVTLLSLRVLVNLEDRPSVNESVAVRADRSSCDLNSRIRSAALAVRDSRPARTALRRCSSTCEANSGFLARGCASCQGVPR